MVLAKEKNDEKALEFLIRSVHKYPMNWGCWLEMTALISRVEDVSINRLSSPRYTTVTDTTSAAESDISTLSPKYRFLHVPSPHIA